MILKFWVQNQFLKLLANVYFNEFFVKSSWSTMNSYMNYIPAALRAAAP